MSHSEDVEQASYQGSVNRWECDENDHLNVRFYCSKLNQALQVFVLDRGWCRDPDAILRRVTTQHIRFLREARMATPLRVDCAVVAFHERDQELRVLGLMRSSADGDELAAIVTTLNVSGWQMSDAVDCAPIPQSAAPRGLDADAEHLVPKNLTDALAAGFVAVGRGVIGVDEVGADGAALPHACIGRISDGTPVLWTFPADAQHDLSGQSGELGGAVLEYRLLIHEPIRRGSVFTHLAGIRALGNKTQHMTHALFDESKSVTAVTAETIGVAMDLATRKAVIISPERRAHLAAMLIDPDGV